jgi:protein subunit release factor A
MPVPLVEVRSGVGDDEADRWTADLHRIISQYADHKRWVVDQRERDASPAGFRRAVLAIRGPGAYARLRWLHGTHRVQREPPGSPGRIRTSTAVVLIEPLPGEVADRPDADRRDASAKIRTCNYAEDRVTDHRIGLKLHGVDRLVEAHLDHLADRLEAAAGDGPGAA